MDTSKERDTKTPGVKVIEASDLIPTLVEYQPGVFDEEKVNPFCRHVYYKLCKDERCDEEAINDTDKNRKGEKTSG